MTDLLARVRGLEPLIRSFETRIEHEATLPRPVVDALVEAGVFCTNSPREIGGLEVDAPTYFEVVEEMSRVNGSVGWLAMINCGNFLSWFPTEAAVKMFRSKEPYAVFSGNLAPKGRAVRVDGGYRISGRWSFVSGCPHADWILLRAPLYDADAPVLTADGTPDVINAVLRASDVQILPTWDGLGLRGTGSHDVEVSDVFVETERTTGLQDHYPGPLYKAWFFLIGHAAHAVGIGRAAIQSLIDLAEGSAVPRAGALATRAEVQMALAEAEATLQAARAFVWQTTCDAYAQAVETGAIEPRLRMLLKLSMTYAVRSTAQAVSQVFEAAGPPSVYAGRTIERCYRDIHTATQHSLMQTQHYQGIGQYLFAPHTFTQLNPASRRAII
jgi:alkylation response protein AidB-like acyl-CoA dehydrogenase